MLTIVENVLANIPFFFFFCWNFSLCSFLFLVCFIFFFKFLLNHSYLLYYYRQPLIVFHVRFRSPRLLCFHFFLHVFGFFFVTNILPSFSIKTFADSFVSHLLESVALIVSFELITFELATLFFPSDMISFCVAISSAEEIHDELSFASELSLSFDCDVEFSAVP